MKPLTHSQAQDWLHASADGLLTAEQQAQLAAHLHTCAECQAYADELNALEAALGETLRAAWGAPSLPAERTAQLLEHMTGKRPRRAAGLRWLLLLLALAAIAVLGWIWNQSRQPDTATLVASMVSTSSPHSTQVASTQLASAQVTSTQLASTQLPAAVHIAAIPTQTVNCRLGASSQFDVADTLHAGEHYQPLGRGRDDLWLQFRGPVTGVLCWVYIGNVDVRLDEETVTLAEVPESVLPFVDYPPTPTATATFAPAPSATPMPQCSDGQDNDGDGYVDLQDRECSDAFDDNEAN